jgi:uncharacterized protein (DUF305 family)
MRAVVVRRVLAVAACGVLIVGCSTTEAARDDAAATVDARPSGADVCFVEMMVPHHEQAVEMSEILLGKDGVWERGQRLARYIQTVQGQEIDAMTAWLTAWDMALTDAAEQPHADGPDPHPVGSHGGTGHGAMGHGAAAEKGASLMPSCSHDHATMDGMLTDEEMDSLRRADAVLAQRLYLELMIPHHEGALTMAEEALAEAENPFVLSTATHVVQEQVSELESIEAMIAALDAGDLELPDTYVDGEYRTYDTAPASGDADTPGSP